MTSSSVSNQGFTDHNHMCGINFLSHLRGAPQNPRQIGMIGMEWDKTAGVEGSFDRPSFTWPLSIFLDGF